MDEIGVPLPDRPEIRDAFAGRAKFTDLMSRLSQIKGDAGRIVGLEQSEAAAATAARLGACDAIVLGNAGEPLTAMAAVLPPLGGPADLTVSCVNAPALPPPAGRSGRRGGARRPRRRGHHG